MSEPKVKLGGQGGLRRLWNGPNFRWNLFLLALIAVECGVFSMANEKFRSLPRIFASANGDLTFWYVSIFVTFVMITGGIDIQSCAIVGLTSIIIGVAWQDFGFNIWMASLLAVAVSVACGALSGFFVAYCGVQAMVVTLGGSFLYTGLALLVSTLSSTEAYKGISGFPDDFKALTKIKVFGVIPLQIIIFLVLLAAAYLLLHRS